MEDKGSVEQNMTLRVDTTTLSLRRNSLNGVTDDTSSILEYFYAKITMLGYICVELQQFTECIYFSVGFLNGGKRDKLREVLLAFPFLGSLLPTLPLQPPFYFCFQEMKIWLKKLVRLVRLRHLQSG